MIVEEFTQQGYQILEKLGHNSSGGRVTYKALHLATSEMVVIKQFQFLSQSWTVTEYDAYEKELTALRQLSHRGIPRYLDSFETEGGLCLVQQYIKAQSLALPQNWKLEEIKQIALSVLEILIYLQSQTPPIIHRDIKPENILVDEQLNVYLIDFGFARLGGEDLAASSVVKGTMGFMPPEQLFNRELTTASDLYGLGATLICLLTGVKSVEIGSLMDENYQIHFCHLIPPMQKGWISWLEKMVKPTVKERYQLAKQALTALETIDVNQLPKVRLDQTKIELKATTFRKIITHTITVTNPIPNTFLSGRWEVAPHPSDPPHTPYDHSWISISPQKFEGNKLKFEIAVDTSQLVDSSYYERQLILQTNSLSETYTIPLKLKTAPLPPLQKTNFLSLALVFVLFLPLGFLREYQRQSLSIALFLQLLLGIILVPFITIEFVQEERLINEIGECLDSFLCAFIGWNIIWLACLFLNNSLFNQSSFSIIISASIVTALMGASLREREEFNLFINGQKNKYIPGFMGSLFFLIIIIQMPLIMKNIEIIAINLLGFGLGLTGFLFWEFCVENLLKRLLFSQVKRNILLQEATKIVVLTIGIAISLGSWIKLLWKTNLLTNQEMTSQLWGGMGLSLVVLISLVYLWYKYAIANPRKSNKLIRQYQKNRFKLIQP